jgi:hypothetical protein
MIQFLFWLVIAVILITAGGAFHLGYHFGRQDHPRPRPADTHPYAEEPLEADAFDRALQEFIAEEPQHPLERLATTGELQLREQTGWIKARADEFIQSLEGES